MTDELRPTPTCAVCGSVFDPADPPPTFGLRPDPNRPGVVRPVLNKPIRMDPETGAVCWCPPTSTTGLHVVVSDAVPGDTIALIPPPLPDETVEDHAKRCGVIRGLPGTA